MHSNSITILGVLKSKNVNGEDRSNTNRIRNRITNVRRRIRTSFFKQENYFIGSMYLLDIRSSRSEKITRLTTIRNFQNRGFQTCS